MGPARVIFDYSNEHLDAVANAIEQATQPGREGPFGLYDYTSYGHPCPHHVRDFRSGSPTYGMAVLMTTDPNQARELYEALCRRHVAQAAIAAAFQGA